MIDVARIVAVGTAIDDGRSIDDEQKRVVVFDRLVAVAVIRFPMRHPVAEILDDPGALAYPAPRKHASAVQPRTAHADHIRARRDEAHAWPGTLTLGLTLTFALALAVGRATGS
jgi:hypothetical protein